MVRNYIPKNFNSRAYTRRDCVVFVELCIELQFQFTRLYKARQRLTDRRLIQTDFNSRAYTRRDALQDCGDRRLSDFNSRAYTRRDACKYSCVFRHVYFNSRAYTRRDR